MRSFAIEEPGSPVPALYATLDLKNPIPRSMCWLPVVRASRASDSLSGSFSDNLHLGSDQILIKIISNLRWMLEQKSDMEEVEMMRHHLVHHVNLWSSLGTSYQSSWSLLGTSCQWSWSSLGTLCQRLWSSLGNHPSHITWQSKKRSHIVSFIGGGEAPSN